MYSGVRWTDLHSVCLRSRPVKPFRGDVRRYPNLPEM
jgi:hypothetical protein